MNTKVIGQSVGKGSRVIFNTKPCIVAAVLGKTGEAREWLKLQMPPTEYLPDGYTLQWVHVSRVSQS